MTEKFKEEESICVKGVKQCRSYIQFLKNEINKYFILNVIFRLSRVVDSKDKLTLELVKLEIDKKEYAIRDIEDVLPRSTG